MTKRATWGLIGHGNIGREIRRQIAQPEVAKRLGLESEPLFVMTSKGIQMGSAQSISQQKLTELASLPDVVFIAIPSSDDGNVAYQYISHLLKQGKMVVTAEKGGLANHFEQLKDESGDFSRLGITATVGGGTRLLQVAREYCQDIGNIQEIHLVLNGTLAAILDWVSPLSGKGLSLPEAAQRAVESGYAEPGSDSPAAIIRGEAEGDIPKKLAIFCNSVGLSEHLLDWNSLRFSLSDEQISQATNPQIPHRFIVSLYPMPKASQQPADSIGGFNVQHDKWQLIGGFRRVDTNPLFGALATLAGPGNGMVLGLGPQLSDGVYAVTGPGAGVSPTVNTMLDDFVRLNGTRKA